MLARYMAWQHSYNCMEGFQFSYARPLGQVHKNGHAILCAYIRLEQLKKNEHETSNIYY